MRPSHVAAEVEVRAHAWLEAYLGSGEDNTRYKSVERAKHMVTGMIERAALGAQDTNEFAIALMGEVVALIAMMGARGD